MLIVFGGFPGSGRRKLAKEAAKRLGYHYYDIDQKKLLRRIHTKEGVREWMAHPNSDDQRLLLNSKVVADFRMLSKMYVNVVLDDIFHRALPREEFFAKAQKYFGTLLFVWIELNDESAKERLCRRGPPYSERAVRRRELAQKEFQAFTVPVPIFSFAGSVDDAQGTFYEFIRKGVDAVQ
jgi:predicted kinase